MDVERSETLTMGFLLLLERLTPLERAVFVLHDVLDYPYREIADAVGRWPSRPAGRRCTGRATTSPSRSAGRRPTGPHAALVAQRFLAAGLGGDVEAFVAALAPDIVLTSDGGGLVHAAAMRPVVGAHRVTRFLGNLAARFGDDTFVVAHELNGAPGFVIHAGGAWVALVVEVSGRAGHGDPRRRQPPEARAPPRHPSRHSRASRRVGDTRPLPRTGAAIPSSRDARLLASACGGERRRSDWRSMPTATVPAARHLLRAKDLADARYAEPLTVADMARAAGLSPAHFSREFRRAFGESPHQYLLTRRLERAAALLRTTDWSVAGICFAVGLPERRLVHDELPAHVRRDADARTGPRSRRPPRYAVVPACVVRGLRAPATPHVSRRRRRRRSVGSSAIEITLDPTAGGPP